MSETVGKQAWCRLHVLPSLTALGLHVPTCVACVCVYLVSDVGISPASRRFRALLQQAPNRTPLWKNTLVTLMKAWGFRIHRKLNTGMWLRLNTNSDLTAVLPVTVAHTLTLNMFSTELSLGYICSLFTYLGPAASGIHCFPPTSDITPVKMCWFIIPRSRKKLQLKMKKSRVLDAASRL